jgi:glutamyl-tRNA reductase
LAEYLSRFEPRELVGIGRTPERLMSFCDTYSGRPATIKELAKELPNIDILFSATACPRVLITKEMVEKARGNGSRLLRIVDIAMPADIDPSVSGLPYVQYFSIDDLRDISSKNLDARKSEVVNAEIIIAEELERMRYKLENLHIEHFLTHINKYTEELRRKEIEKALNMLETPDPKVTEIMDGLSRSLTKKIMHNFLLEARNNPGMALEIEKFVNTFTGNGNVPEREDEKTEE